MPISLSDDQLNAIIAASLPIQANRRSDFLAAVARELAQLPDCIGDGSVHRVIMRVQKVFFDPPEFGDHGVAKYNRVDRRAKAAAGVARFR